jgi:hypothetical protein
MDHQSTTPQVPPAAAEPGLPPVTGADATPAQGGFGLREFLLVGLALVGGLFITYALLMGRGVPTHAAAAPVADGPARREVKSAPKPQQWSDARREVWLGARRKGVAFDLVSNENVSAWMKNVRPVLVVRCQAGSMEAFVVTETAAQIEPRTEAHTVTFRFDDQAPVTERWPDSSEHDALFAPDGAAFAARVAAAQVMSFRFTPHNAAAVTAEFQVAGLGALLEPAAKHCSPPRHRR